MSEELRTFKIGNNNLTFKVSRNLKNQESVPVHTVEILVEKKFNTMSNKERFIKNLKDIKKDIIAFHKILDNTILLAGNSFKESRIILEYGKERGINIKWFSVNDDEVAITKNEFKQHTNKFNSAANATTSKFENKNLKLEKRLEETEMRLEKNEKKTEKLATTILDFANNLMEIRTLEFRINDLKDEIEDTKEAILVKERINPHDEEIEELKIALEGMKLELSEERKNKRKAEKKELIQVTEVTKTITDSSKGVTDL